MTGKVYRQFEGLRRDFPDDCHVNPSVLSPSLPPLSMTNRNLSPTSKIMILLMIINTVNDDHRHTNLPEFPWNSRRCGRTLECKCTGNYFQLITFPVNPWCHRHAPPPSPSPPSADALWPINVSGLVSGVQVPGPPNHRIPFGPPEMCDCLSICLSVGRLIGLSLGNV